MTPALLLTYSRIVAVPLVILLYYLDWRWSNYAAASLFAAAALTDWLDGFLARRMNQTTELGAFLDPVADKIMVCAVLVMLVEVYHNFWMTTAAIVIVVRELVISALREWLAAKRLRETVAVSWLGKCKTTLQLIAVVALLSLERESAYALHAQLLLWFSALLTVASMVAYCYQAWRALRPTS